MLELSSLAFLLRHPLSYSGGHVCCREKQEEEGAGTKGFADVGGGAGASQFPGMGGGANTREFAGVGGGTVAKGGATAKKLFGCEGFLSSGVGEGDQSTGVSDGLKKPDRAELEGVADCGGRKG